MNDAKDARQWSTLPEVSEDDAKFALLAIAEATKCQSEPGLVRPKVGVVVVRDGVVLATAFRGELKSGEHAEFTALERKLGNEIVAGATVYTTLEPCTVRNPPKSPCVEWLIKRKIARVVIGQLDPNPDIRGNGQLLLRSSNIEVGLFPSNLMARVEDLNRHFSNSFVDDRQPASAPATSTPSWPAPELPTGARGDLIGAAQYIDLHRQARESVSGLKALADQLGWSSISKRSEAQLRVLRDDIYRVAIVGKSRAGKSSLLNALVRRRLCPVQQVLTTAVPITICPGEREAAVVVYKNGERRPIDGPITSHALAPYADQKHNPDNEKQVEQLIVNIDHEVLALGVAYVDIPGFDDPSGEIWTAAEAAIKAANALVVVLDVSTVSAGGFAPDRQLIEILKSARVARQRVIIVGNKADGLTDEDVTKAREIIARTLQRFGLSEAIVFEPFFLSAQLALLALESGSTTPKAFDEFASALWRVLWETDSTGLRRLYRVFDELRKAGLEAAALVSIRTASGPQRANLRSAIVRCVAGRKEIEHETRVQIERVRGEARAAFETQRDQLRGTVRQYVDGLSAESLPKLNKALETFARSIVEANAAVVRLVEPRLQSVLRSTSEKILGQLEELYRSAMIPSEIAGAAKGIRLAKHWHSQVVDVDSRGVARLLGLAVSGGGVFALAVGALGAPILLAAGAALFVSSAFEYFTENVDSREELMTRINEQLETRLGRLASALDDAIVSIETQTISHVLSEASPFIADLERRLAEMRDLTNSELTVLSEMGTQIEAASRLFESLQLATGMPV